MRHVEKPVRKSYRFHDWIMKDLEELKRLTSKSETRIVEEAIEAYLRAVRAEKEK